MVTIDSEGDVEQQESTRVGVPFVYQPPILEGKSPVPMVELLWGLAISRIVWATVTDSLEVKR